MASAAPMPRAAPVTTAVRPSSLKSPPLSIAKHCNPHSGGCGLCYMILNCIRRELMCPEQIGTNVQGSWSALWPVGRVYALRESRLFAESRDTEPPSAGGPQAVRRRGLRHLILVLRPYVDAAVNVYGLAGDIVAVFHQVADGAGDLVRLAEAAEGDLLAEFLLGFLGDV